jgi:hypothetical protein
VGRGRRGAGPVSRRPAARGRRRGFLATGALAALYAVASVVMFGIFGGFLTYPLLTLVGDVRMLRSSVALHLTPGVAAGLVLLPRAYVVASLASGRLVPSRASAIAPAVSLALLLAWVVAGHYAYAREWTTRQDRRIAENAHWVLASSMIRSAVSDDTVSLDDDFADADLGDFAPPVPAARDRVRPARLVTRLGPPRRQAGYAAERDPRRPGIRPPRGGPAWATRAIRRRPRSRRKPVTRSSNDNFYAHIGRSSNSAGRHPALDLPKLDFQDVTEEYPELAARRWPRPSATVAIARRSSRRAI